MNPTLERLEFLVGKWSMELSNASFLPDPSTTIKGTASFEWLEGGDFLVMRQGEKSDSMWATWLISRDENSKNYAILYFDNRRVSRVYEMSFNHVEWKIWRSSPKFSQRFVGKVSKDQKKIKAYWEKSPDGKTWEHDFDLLYVKES